jgi:hypothetical protein
MPVFSASAKAAPLALLGLVVAGCSNCAVHEVSSAGNVAVGQRWVRSPDQVEGYFCKVESWQGAPNANGAHSNGPDCQTAREFFAFFDQDGKRYRARIQGGLVVSLGRRGVCIDM